MKKLDFRNLVRLRLNGVIAMLCPGSERPTHQIGRTLRSIARDVKRQQACEERAAARKAGVEQ